MASLKGIRWLVPGLAVSGLLFVIAPTAEPTKIESLAKARHEAAVKQYDETWAYYQQARIDSYQVYVWSRIVLDCRRDLAKNPADQIAALEEHLGRMNKLETLVTRIRRLGFGRSYDVGSAAYYRLEAEYWLEVARSAK
jgi:hypothetical protein